MTLYEKIINSLKSDNISYEEIRHRAVHTSVEAAIVRGCNINIGAKALVFLADNDYILAVIEGGKRVDLGILKAKLSVNTLQLADPIVVKDITGVEIGAVPPFGNLFERSVKTYVNKSFLKNEDMEFNAGDHCISIRMKVYDWLKLINPIIADFEDIKTKAEVLKQ